MLTSVELNLTGKSFIELLSLFLCEIKEDDDYYMVIGFHLAKEFPKQFEFLINEFDGKRLRGAIFGIGVAKGNIECILPYLSHYDEKILSETIDALIKFEYWDAWEDIQPMLTHDSPYVRSAVLRFIRAMFVFDARTYLFAALKDESYIVRENAVDELDGILLENDKPQIEALLNDESEDVKCSVKYLLESNF